ncbi:hypothetical protein ISN45_Aa06g032380 [Arabidopsis thaliana x Arabidopsis arenosa]|uniref:Uncharacterized protein n=1 Tax=Arabidopsis thaliana x Arabidopsis arenosa TaxID=1240361 RepID=A0A8T1Z1H2_9BRAS|nr:hypothetical protein ISN45_Aa06g032380 [Arabidopsis thaliana x Arabidopsis arenosa]
MAKKGAKIRAQPFSPDYISPIASRQAQSLIQGNLRAAIVNRRSSGVTYTARDSAVNISSSDESYDSSHGPFFLHASFPSRFNSCFA